MADETTTTTTAAPTPVATTTTSPTPTPTLQVPTLVPAPTTPAPNVINVSPEEYRQWQDDKVRLAQHDAELSRQKAEANAKEFKALADKGEIERAMNLYKQEAEDRIAAEKKTAHDRIEAERKAALAAREATDRELAARDIAIRNTEARAQRYALDGELSRALATHNLNEGAAEELTQLLRPQLVAQPDGESFSVRTPSGQTAVELVTQYLARRPHHLRAQNPGGGTGGVSPDQTPPQPGNPGTEPTAEQKFRQAIAANPDMPDGERMVLMSSLGLYPQASATPVDAARGNMTVPFGTKRKIG